MIRDWLGGWRLAGNHSATNNASWRFVSIGIGWLNGCSARWLLWGAWLLGQLRVHRSWLRRLGFGGKLGITNGRFLAFDADAGTHVFRIRIRLVVEKLVVRGVWLGTEHVADLSVFI